MSEAGGMAKPSQRPNGNLLFLVLAIVLSPPFAGAVWLSFWGVAVLIVRLIEGMPANVLFEELSQFWILPGVGGYVGAIVGWPLILVWGLLVHAVLYGSRRVGLASYVGAGTICAFVTAGAIALFSVATSQYSPFASGLSVASFFAQFVGPGMIITAAIFWFIRRPDQDFASL